MFLSLFLVTNVLRLPLHAVKVYCDTYTCSDGYEYMGGYEGILCDGDCDDNKCCQKGMPGVATTATQAFVSGVIRSSLSFRLIDCNIVWFYTPFVFPFVCRVPTFPLSGKGLL